MKTALIACDVQLDFLPDGALPICGAEEILHPLELIARESLVIATRNWFPSSFGSGDHALFCIQETKGAKIHPRIRKLVLHTISKGMESVHDSYSAFSGRTLRPVQTLEEILRKQEIQRVIVGGLTLDTCVRCTALDANALGYSTIVPLDCTVAFTAEGGQAALESFERAGVQTVDHWS